MSRHSRRTGMTLLELLLVLAVLALLAGLSAPYLQRYLAVRELKSNVTELRVELSGGRIKSVDTGLIYQFRSEPQGQRFVVLPYEALNTAASEMAAHAGSEGGAPLASGHLTARCMFLPPPEASLTQATLTERLPEEWLAQMPNGYELRDVQWSPPLLFYPDGTASDGTVTISDDEGRQMTLFIRGLTGGVSVGDLVYGAPQ